MRPPFHPGLARPVARTGLAALLCLMPLAGASVSGADGPSLTSIAKGYLGKAITSAKGLGAGSSEAKGKSASASDPDAAAREAVLAKARDSIFLEKDGYHFTQSKWGASPAPYQIDGLELVLLPEGSLGASDLAAGIDRRVGYEIRCRAHRVFKEPKGWGEWRKSSPPHLEGFTLVREQGVWKVSVSPSWAYSLR
jgi:hypothetical protein